MATTDIAHSDEALRIHTRILDTAALRQSFVDVDDGRVHLLERRHGPPVVLLHGADMERGLSRGGLM